MLPFGRAKLRFGRAKLLLSHEVDACPPSRRRCRNFPLPDSDQVDFAVHRENLNRQATHG